jgi:hypothetical protein
MGEAISIFLQASFAFWHYFGDLDGYSYVHIWSVRYPGRPRPWDRRCKRYGQDGTALVGAFEKLNSCGMDVLERLWIVPTKVMPLGH